MSQQSSSSQEEMKPIDWGKILHEDKMTLDLLDAALKPGRKLREMDKNVINSFIEDLAMIDEKVKAFDFHNNLQLANQASLISSNIQDAIMEFILALDLLDTEHKLEPKDIEFIRRRFYACLGNGQKYIQEALQQFP
ncbi:MAG TPA: hypothetical protein VNE38_18755 [Ktedonobacteraceae bacterium]|nr:hypothetical protein [Ktedonobacteraceae bacterium]